MGDSVLPPGLTQRFLSREQAAAYLGVSPPTFDYEVARGVWPKPMRRGPTQRRITWDRVALDAAADRSSGLSSSAGQAPRQHASTWD